MNSTSYFCLCLIFGSIILCNGKLEKRQAVSSCSVDTFTCSNGLCIDSSLTCDGRKDCSDGSDETQDLCSTITCPNFLFRCKYGACVSKNSKCNGIKDCADGSDETSECQISSSSVPANRPIGSCQSDQYSCKSGQCIEDTHTCDGIKNCDDGSDETLILCKKNVCPAYLFKCKYGACISKTNRCDGVKQCFDGSDENQCPNSSPKPTPKPTKPTEPSISPTTSVVTKKTCVIPTTEGSIYTYYNSNQQTVLSPGTLVDQNRLVEENCEKEYHKIVSQRIMICTETGQWQPSIDKLCLRKCQPMMSDSLDIKCTLNGQTVDCSKPSIPGTKLRPKCKITHSLPNGQIETTIDLICYPDGNWSGRLYICIPYCGRTTIKAEKLIFNGTIAKYGEAPWNVGIYRMQNNTYDMICGGTLISSNLIVSAAHCFWEKGITDRKIKNNGMYKVAVGKYKRDISIKDNEFTQIIDVGLIFIKDDYDGDYGNQAVDIAVIVLPTKITLSTVVAPACVDWTQTYTISNGSMGMVVGWGLTEHMVPSSDLLEANIPYISYADCRKMYTNGFQIYVTPDKFCAGSQSGTGVHKGDSGAGLTYPHNGLQYLTGIVSVKDPNSNSAFAVFTDVSHHIEWVSNIYNNYTFHNES